VHVPLALAVLLPVVSLLTALAITQRALPARAWVGIFLLHLVLAGSAWAAVASGEREEEAVERIVGEGVLAEHEEGGERTFFASLLVLAVSGAGLLSGRAGARARQLTVLVSLLPLGLALWTGHTGGELVYRHGAANAHVSPGGSAPPGVSRAPAAHADD
jgi:uncharacterized membrane protein